MGKHYNIILANAPINNGNRGCVALSITVMHIIDKLLSDSGIDYTLFLPDSHYKTGKEYEIKIMGKNISFFDTEYCNGITSRENLKLFVKGALQRKDFTLPYKKADFILDIGQGDSFSDIYGERRFKSIDRIHDIARKYNKPYCILPQTIGPFTNSKIKAKANVSIEKATLCMVRDKQSFDYVINNVPSQKTIKEYIDVAFLMPFEKIKLDSKYINVGLNISSLLWHGGYTKNNQFGLRDDYKNIVKNILDYFLTMKDVKVHLVPHVVGQERGIENDYEVAYELWREHKEPNIVLAPFALGPIEIKSYIAGLDFFMGARMHATIAAFSSGVPVVPMAYSRKFNGLFQDTLQYDYMVDLKKDSQDEILSKIKR